MKNKWVYFPMFGCKKGSRLKIYRLVIVFFLMSSLVLFGGKDVRAQLPPPSWMPNSPILAGNQVIILWLPVPGAVKYTIYVNGKKEGEATGVQHIMAAPEEAGEYKVEIASVGAKGKEGKKSTPGVFKIITVEPPKSLITRVAEDKVLIRWDKPRGAVIFNLYRADTRGGEFKLLDSIQDNSYTDSDVKAGKKYYYAVSSKDLAGKESKRSNAVEVSLLVLAKEEQVKVELKVIPSEETSRFGFLEGKRLVQITDVKVEKETGDIWIVKENKIFRINGSGEILDKIGPVKGVDKFLKMDFGADGNLYLSDYSAKVYSLSRQGGINWTVQAPKPPADNKIIWTGIPEHKRKLKGIGGDVLCLKDELWVIDQRFGIIYVFDYRGKFKRYSYQYTDTQGKTKRVSGIGEMELLKDNRILLTHPIAHLAMVIDKEFKEQFTIGKVGSGFVGKFIGISGVFELSDGSIVLTDPAVNSIQVFDGKTGKYLYHIGGEEAVEDPAQPGRAKVDFGAINYTQFLSDTDFIVYTGTEKAIMFRKLSQK